jgi:hypothetical protein
VSEDATSLILPVTIHRTRSRSHRLRYKVVQNVALVEGKVGTASGLHILVYGKTSSDGQQNNTTVSYELYIKTK